MKKRFMLMVSVFILVFGLTGCGSRVSEEATDQTHAPVTLKLYTDQPMTADDFNLLIADPVKKKYPYITVEMMDRNVNLRDLVATNQQVDLITMWNGNINSYKDLGIFEDITPLAQKANFDLGRFDQGALKTLRALSDKGELYGLPYNLQFNALYYNKDIFDKFGVPYPKEGMTWDDVVALAKQLTRMDGGVQYSGLGMDTWPRLTYPLSLIPVDAKTNQASVNNDLYRKAFTIGKQLFSIPGNPPNFTTNAFIKDKTQAMMVGVNYLDLLSKEPDLNWDVAQFPSYKENPNVYGMYDLHVILASSTSKYKDEDMKVLEVLFSDEVQKISTRQTGRVSLLTNPEIRQAFGADNPALKGKRIDSIFKSTAAFCPPFSIYQSKGTQIMLKHYQDYLADKVDLNTALSNAEEEINNYIKTQ